LTAVRAPKASLVVAVLVLVQLLVLYVVFHNGAWVFDDNFFLVLTGQEGFVRALTSVQFEHWDIGENAAISLQHLLFWFDYRWALAAMLLVLGGAAIVFERTIAMLVRSRWISLGFTVWFGLSLLWARPLQWWSGGVQYFPYTFFNVVCVYGFLRYHATDDLRWVAMSVAALAGALLFYEKPAFMIGYLVLIRVLLMNERLKPAAVAKLLWRERYVWLAYVAVIAVWSLGYFNSGAFTSHPGPTAGQYVDYFQMLWLRNFVPTLAGVTIPAGHIDGGQVLFIVLSQIVVAAVVVFSVARSRPAWRGWVFLGVVFVVSGILVARQRIWLFGVDIADDPRYLIDYSWLVPLALCAVFSRSGLLLPARPTGRMTVSLPARGWIVTVLAGGLLAAYVASSVGSAAALQRAWPGHKARVWEDNLRSGFAELERRGIHPVVADDAPPFEVFDNFVGQYDRLSRMLRLYVGPVQVGGPLDGPLYRIGSDGRPRPAAFDSPLGGSRLTEMLRSREAALSPGARLLRRGAYSCVIADGSPVTVTRLVPRATGAPGTAYYLHASYRTWGGLVAPVTVAGYAPGLPPAGYPIALGDGTGSTIAWLGDAAPQSVAVTIPPLNTVCFDRFEVATLRGAG